MAQDFDADAMLAFFGQLGKEVDNLKTKITSLNEVGGKGTSNLTNEFARFGQTVQHYTRGPLRAMDQAAAGLARTLMGAGGLAVGFAGAAKALDQFAVGELRLRNFATNTGFSTGAIKDMRVQLAAAGIDAGEAASGIGSIGSKLQEVLALQETSGFYRTLQASSPALAEQVRQLMNMGRQQEAMNVLQQAYNNGGERFKAWLPTATGLSKAAFEAGKYGMEGLIKPWTFNDDKAKEYHKTMTNLETVATGVWTSMSYTMMEAINKMIGDAGGIEKLNQKAKEFATGFKSFFDTYVMPTLKTTKEEFGWVVTGLNKMDELLAKWTGREEGGDAMAKISESLGAVAIGRALGTQPSTPEQDEADRIRRNRLLGGGVPGSDKPSEGGFWEWLKKQFSMEAGAAEVGEGSGPLLVQEEETDKDSNRLLRDMRDTMQKWDSAEDGGGGAFGGRAGGGGFAGTGVPSAGGAAVGGPQGPMGRSGPGPGQSYPQSKGGGGPAETTADLGDSGPVGTLAEQRAGFKKELEDDPQLKKLAIGAMASEGGVQSNLEQLMNMATMRKQTIRQALYSGQYGPVTGRNKLSTEELLRRGARQGQVGEDALEKVYAGSNITDYATDQGMKGDPNYDKYMSNRAYWGMHKVEGAWFSAHGEKGRRWAEQQRAAAAKAGTGAWSGKTPVSLPYADWSRDPIDSALRASRGHLGTADINIDFTGANKKKVENDRINNAFIDVKIHRSPQAPLAGGGVSAFNTYAFE